MSVFTGMLLRLSAALHTDCLFYIFVVHPAAVVLSAVRACGALQTRSGVPGRALHRLPSAIDIMVMCPLFRLAFLLLVLVPI